MPTTASGFLCEQPYLPNNQSDYKYFFFSQTPRTIIQSIHVKSDFNKLIMVLIYVLFSDSGHLVILLYSKGEVLGRVRIIPDKYTILKDFITDDSFIQILQENAILNRLQKRSFILYVS